jgi:hypothetical protein
MKHLIMQFSPTSCHFISLWSKYSPQECVKFKNCLLRIVDPTPTARNLVPNTHLSLSLYKEVP